MKILRVAVGNSKEAFIESRFTEGLNIISSDDNNKGKTIVIQSMMYALGNEPTFPTSFEYQKYYYYVEFEEHGKNYQICRSGNGFVLSQGSSILIFDNVAELKRYWSKHIFSLPAIVKNQLSMIVDTSYSFDVSTVEMRTEIINSISEKIAAYAEEIQRLSAEICAEQEKMQSLMEDENVSLESIVAYKKDIFSASDAEGRIKDIENEITSLKSQLVANENSSQETQARRVSLLTAILGKMNELYHQIDPDGNLTYTSLFTQRNEVYSGSEATVFHLVKLFALQQVLRHNCPIIVDSFRAEDLSTGKEKTVLEISKSINNQVILTTTLKHEELGKYDSIEGVNHINYISHIPSKILDGRYVADFLGLLSALSIKVQS